MDQYVESETNSDRQQDRAASHTVAERINFEAIPSPRGSFVREDERPRTESYGELWQRASIHMRRS